MTMALKSFSLKLKKEELIRIDYLHSNPLRGKPHHGSLKEFKAEESWILLPQRTDQDVLNIFDLNF